MKYTRTVPYQPSFLHALSKEQGFVCFRDQFTDRLFFHPRITQVFDTPDMLAIPSWLKANQQDSFAAFYLSYDLAPESLGLSRKPSGIPLPLACIQLYDAYVDVDHTHKTMTVHAMYEALADSHSQFLASLSAQKEAFYFRGSVNAGFSYEAYEQAFKRVRAGLEAGDYYQVNVANCFEVGFQGSAISLFEALTDSAPSAYASFWTINEGMSLLCNSPESFIHVDDQVISTTPIKGTIRRSADPVEDEVLKLTLASSVKDQAENLMIVDLLRNDLGKLAIPGSVKVEALFEVMTLSYAHHLISRITALLPQDAHPFDALIACFPGGSITGAPKRAAIEAIHAIEPNARHIYCGSMGYLSPRGTLRSNIAIRTAIVHQDRLTFWAGGGLVLDSDCEQEYQECLTKITPILKLIEEQALDSKG